MTLATITVAASSRRSSKKSQAVAVTPETEVVSETPAVSTAVGAISAPGSKGSILSSKPVKAVTAFATAIFKKSYRMVGIGLAIWGALAIGKYLMGMLRKDKTSVTKAEEVKKEDKSVISGGAVATA